MENLNKQKLVSIIIPVFNGDKYLSDAIESAVSQTYKNIEIIVIDDGSFKDNNYKPIIEKFNSNNIKFIKMDKNGGVSSAMNLAIKKSNGYYINWLSHDDFFHRDKIQKQISILEKDISINNVCLSHSISFNDKTKFNRKIKVRKFLINKKNWLLMSDKLHGCSLLLPKHLIIEAGFFDEDLKFTQDYDMWMRLRNKGVKFLLCDDYLLFSRRHPSQDSISKYDEVFYEKNIFYINKLSEFFDNEKSMLIFNINIYFIFFSFIYRGYASILINFIEIYKKKNLFSKIYIRAVMISVLLIALPIYYLKKYTISLRNKLYYK